MKSSPKQEPKIKNAQNWTPVDFFQISSQGTQKPIGDNGKPVNLFDYVIGSGNDANTRVIKADQKNSSASWLPDDLAHPVETITCEKTAWQPSIKFATATAPQDISRELITNAHREAETIIKNAQQEAKGIQEQAYQDGWNNAMGEIKCHMDTASTLVREISSWRDNLMAQSEQIILELVRSIAQKMFGEGFELDKETLQVTFNKVLENARTLGNLRVYVNPEDASSLGPYWREFQESITSHTIEIIPTNSIARGGCYVNGQWGSADGRIETQLKAILDTFDSETEITEK